MHSFPAEPDAQLHFLSNACTNLGEMQVSGANQRC